MDHGLRALGERMTEIREKTSASLFAAAREEKRLPPRFQKETSASLFGPLRGHARWTARSLDPASTPTCGTEKFVPGSQPAHVR